MTIYLEVKSIQDCEHVDYRYRPCLHISFEHEGNYYHCYSGDWIEDGREEEYLQWLVDNPDTTRAIVLNLVEHCIARTITISKLAFAFMKRKADLTFEL